MARRILVGPAVLLLAEFIGCGGSSQPSPSQPNFTITLSTESVFVPIGVGSGTIKVSVQAVNGFSQPVSISFTGLPSGVTPSPPLPALVNPGDNKTITLTATATTQPAVKNITVNGNTGTINQTANFSLSAAAPSYAYLATGSSNAPPYGLVGFAVDANTGALTQVPGSPVSLPNMALDLAVASESGGAFVFTLTGGNSGQMSTYALQSYGVDAVTGALTALQTINYSPDGGQSSLAVSPSQGFLYVAGGTCTIAYTIDPATGNLTQSSCSRPQGEGLTVAPPGNFAYQLQPEPLDQANLYLFSVNQTDGSLTLLQTYMVNLGGLLTTDPQGHALYQMTPVFDINTCSSAVIFRIDPTNGTLTNLNTSFAPLCEVFSQVFNPADTFSYVTSGGGENNGPNGIYAAAVDPATGNLTNISGSPFASGSFAAVGAVEPSQGRFLMEVQAGSQGTSQVVQVYAINSSTGALSQLSGVRAMLPSPNALSKMLAVSPNP